MFPDTWHKMLTKVCLLVLLRSQEGVGNTGVNMLVKTSSIDQNDQEVASQKRSNGEYDVVHSIHCSAVKSEKPADNLCGILSILFAGGIISSMSFWIKSKLLVLR